MSYEIPLYRVTLVRESTIDFEDRPIFTSAADVDRVMRGISADSDREIFSVVLLSAKHRIIGVNVVSMGSLTATLVHPREVFKPAILANAAALILCHNHPSGDPTPSQEDLEITRRLRSGAEILGIRLLDHVILGDGTYLSFADTGRL